MIVRTINISNGEETVHDYTQADIIAMQSLAPSSAQVITTKKQAVRKVREDILNRLVGIAFAASLSGDTATVDAYGIVRQGLLNITSDWPTNPDQIDSLVTNRYIFLVNQCTPQMISAFAQVDV